jgi:8-oxo-dGTP diphosphatase
MSELPVEVSGRAMILDQRGRVLILKRSENSGSNPGKWELPGGKPNKGESFEESFRREVLEETGFLITIHQSAGTTDQLVSGYHVIHVVVIASIQSGGLSISDEHSEYQWAEINKLGALDKADWFSMYYQTYLCGPERAEDS